MCVFVLIKTKLFTAEIILKIVIFKAEIDLESSKETLGRGVRVLLILHHFQETSKSLYKFLTSHKQEN